MWPATNPDEVHDPDLGLVMRIFTELGFTCHQSSKSPYFFELYKRARHGEALVNLQNQTVLVKTNLARKLGTPHTMSFHLADPTSIEQIGAWIKLWKDPPTTKRNRQKRRRRGID